MNDVDEAFAALKEAERRRVVEELIRAQQLPAESASIHESTVYRSKRERTILHHVHLPHLDEGNYIEWDRDAHIIAPGPRFDELLPYMTTRHGRLPGRSSAN